MYSNVGEKSNLVQSKQLSSATLSDPETSTYRAIDNATASGATAQTTAEGDLNSDEQDVTHSHGESRCDCGGQKHCEKMNGKHFSLELDDLPPRALSDTDHGNNRASWHCHKRVKPKPDRVAQNQLIVVSVLCFLFMIGETIGGVLSNSLALFTDVLHLASDLLSFLLSLLAMYLARKSRTYRMSFGYQRAEVLGALFSVFMIWLVTGVLLYIAVERILEKHYIDVKADEMLITATVGVVFNIVMGFVLQSEKCCRRAILAANFAHGHGHENGQEPKHNKKSSSKNNHSTFDYQEVEDESTDSETSLEVNRKNLNVRAAFIHILGDIIQSVGVFIAAIIIKTKPEEIYRLADPICTFMFSLLVLFTTASILKDTLSVIMEGVPHDVNYSSLRQELRRIPGVIGVHDLFVWALTLNKNVIAVHLVVDSTMAIAHQTVLERASVMLSQEHHFYQTIIQVEDSEDYSSLPCENCIGPISPR